MNSAFDDLCIFFISSNSLLEVGMVYLKLFGLYLMNIVMISHVLQNLSTGLP